MESERVFFVAHLDINLLLVQLLVPVAVMFLSVDLFGFQASIACQCVNCSGDFNLNTNKHLTFPSDNI